MTSAGAPTKPGGVRPPAAPRFLSLMLAALAVLLPALMAGTRLDRPLSPLELERIDQAIAVTATPDQPASFAARVFYGATLPADARAAFARAPEATAARARLAAVFFVLLASAALYLLVSISRGGSVAVLACLALAGLPPIADDGSALQPETLVALFGLLTTLLLAIFALTVSRRRRPAPVRLVRVVVMGVMAGVGASLAVVSASRGAVVLLIPGAAITLICLVQLAQWIRCWRRGRLTPRTVQALAGRAWPWLLLTLGVTAAGAITLLLTMHRGAVPGPSASPYGVLPPAGLRRMVMVALAILGGVRLLLEGGVRLSQRRRVDPTVILLLFVAVMLMQVVLDGRGMAAQPAAFALAVLVGEGVFTVILLLVGWWIVRTRRRAG